ncbi:hypothetical protein MN608_00631 [Microdochium nivale]|nr:hypothetical protein MN608_00631 [Microdochium nivale]
MAPTKAPIARGAMGHAQRPSTSSRSIVPAIPLAMMPKKTSKGLNGHTSTIAAADKVVTPLDAALTGQDSGYSDASRNGAIPASEPTPFRPIHPMKNGSNGTNVSRSPLSSSSTENSADSGAVRLTETQANGSSNAPEGYARAPTLEKPISSNGLTVTDKLAASTARVASPASSAQSQCQDFPETNATCAVNANVVFHEPDVSFKQLGKTVVPQENGHHQTSRGEQPQQQMAAPSMFAIQNTGHEGTEFHRVHHPHNSNGGDAIFAGFPDSHTPSPAPMSAVFAPPPQPSMNGGRSAIYHEPDHSHSSSVHSNIPPAVRPDVGPPYAAFESYGQGQAPKPRSQHDNFGFNPARFGPPTPLSYHGSHASIDTLNNLEVGGSYIMSPGIPHPAHATANPPIGPHHPGPPFPPFMGPTMYNERSVVAEDQLMESVDYFRAQFDNAELSDCILELVYVDGRRPSVKLSGHKVILCRSPTIKQQAMLARRHSPTASSIVIHANDRFLRSDSWWMAVQRLYLHPLLNLPPRAGNANSKVDYAGDNGDRFEFCLGYAAAGYLLKMQDVLFRGLHMASELLNWSTVEIALAFVLTNTRQRHTDYNADPEASSRTYVEWEYGYGPETRILIDAIINFLISAFPSNFELDTSAVAPATYARIPSLPTTSTSSSPSDTSAPAIARGSNSHHRAKPSRLGNIKFGDLPLTDASDPQGPTSQPSPYSSIISRVLLNLPFDELRAVLCYNGNAGWKSAQARARAIPDIIAARESRRISALDTIRNGSFSDALVIQQRLSANRRYAIVEPWDVLNWNELAAFGENGEPIGVVRNWASAFSVGTSPDQPRVGEVPQSMV